MAQWRDLPNGERQWRGSDGNWYSSEYGASAASAPAPPVIYQAPKPAPGPSEKTVRRAIIITVSLIVIAVVIALAASHKTSTTTPAKVRATGTSLREWELTAKPTLGALGTDLTALAQDARAVTATTTPTATTTLLSEGAVAGDCRNIAFDVRTAQSLPAAPDPKAEGEWSSMLTDLRSLSQECTAGIEENDPSLIVQAAAELDQADGQLVALGRTLGLTS